MLADVIIHCQDVFVPLGIDRHAGAAAVLAALVISVPQGRPLYTGRRAAGLRLRASDLDWEWGEGEEVTGTGEALLMAVTGRAALASRLSGPGAAVLAERCQTGAPRSGGADPGRGRAELCVADDEGIREITGSADKTAAFRPGLIAISHSIGDAQLHERGRQAAGRFAGTAHLLARPAGARS